jgi:hypothetical protein
MSVGMFETGLTKGVRPAPNVGGTIQQLGVLDRIKEEETSIFSFCFLATMM